MTLVSSALGSGSLGGMMAVVGGEGEGNVLVLNRS